MKTMITALIMISTSLFANAEVTSEAKKLVRSESAYLQICPAIVHNDGQSVRIETPAGCLNKINVEGKTVVYKGASKKIEKVLSNIVGNNQFHSITKSQKFTVEGYFTKVVRMGYKRDTFVVTEISNVILPR